MAERAGQDDGSNRRRSEIWRELVLPIVYVATPFVAMKVAIYWRLATSSHDPQRGNELDSTVIFWVGMFFVSLGAFFAVKSIKRSRIARGVNGEWPGHSTLWIGWIKPWMYLGLLLSLPTAGFFALFDAVTSECVPISPYLGLGLLCYAAWGVISLASVAIVVGRDKEAAKGAERQCRAQT